MFKSGEGALVKRVEKVVDNDAIHINANSLCLMIYASLIVLHQKKNVLPNFITYIFFSVVFILVLPNFLQSVFILFYYIIGTRHYLKPLKYIHSFNSPKTLGGIYYFYSHFIGGEIEAHSR